MQVRSVAPLVVGLLAVAGAFITAYIVNPNVSEIRIGDEVVNITFRDALNMLIPRGPSNIIKENSTNPEIETIFSYIEGMHIPPEYIKYADRYTPLEICLLYDNDWRIAYCRTFIISNYTVIQTSEVPKKTVYISFSVARKVMNISSKDEAIAYILDAIKNGDIQGISISDILGLL